LSEFKTSAARVRSIKLNFESFLNRSTPQTDWNISSAAAEIQNPQRLIAAFPVQLVDRLPYHRWNAAYLVCSRKRPQRTVMSLLRDSGIIHQFRFTNAFQNFESSLRFRMVSITANKNIQAPIE
jgi:hypothetical protein